MLRGRIASFSAGDGFGVAAIITEPATGHLAQFRLKFGVRSWWPSLPSNGEASDSVVWASQ
jgi:hypothetical protein